MAVRGIICLGLLDSTSDVLTLGLEIDTVAVIDAGIELQAVLFKHNVSADLETHNVRATLTKPDAYREDDP